MHRLRATPSRGRIVPVPVLPPIPGAAGVPDDMSLLLTVTYHDAAGELHSRWPRKVEAQAEIEASAQPVVWAIRREGGCEITLAVMDDQTARTMFVARVK